MYRYGFQGQEKQIETGWSSFKWRNSIPELGRFFNVDPLSEQYAYQSHYNFSENAVVAHRELEGLEKRYVLYTPFGVITYTSAAAGSRSQAGIYETAKSNAISNYNGLVRIAGNNYNIIKGSIVAGVALTERVLNTEGKEKKGDSKDSNAKEKKDNSADEKAAINKRPSGFRKKTVEKSWDDAENGSEADTKKCPDCGKEVKGNPHKKEKRNTDDGWDVDHQPKIKDRQPKDTRKEVLDDYNEGTRLRCRKCNRSDNQ